MRNLDVKTIEGFGEQWKSFDQSKLSQTELQVHFDAYFNIFPWDSLPESAVGFDLGCGSGRLAKFVAPRVGILHCIDPSEGAIQVARKNLKDHHNCEFYVAGVDNIPLPDESMDFGYAVGVFHYVPNPFEAIKSCVAKLKAGAPFLVYIYYALENKPGWFWLLWKVSDLFRRVISKLPYFLKYYITSVIAVLIYYPLARLSLILEKLGFNVEVIPLSAYRRRSFYTMRTDALDRFGTPIERRFTSLEIQDMMEKAGLERIQFSNSSCWCAVGYKKKGRSCLSNSFESPH
jgi:ubiquinone/menaquinone biosynthesis C-methylase UbiE